ncbi:MAG: Ig-like domain-containing protein, partial [Mycobacteriales bacterium]
AGAPALPAPDATGGPNMSATAGKVRLIDASAAVVDLVGYGTTANQFEGTGPAPTMSNAAADARAAAGCTDTDDNAADLALINPPTPRNTSTAASPCGAPPGDSAPTVSSTSPADNAIGVADNANISVTFSEPVNATGSAFAVNCASSGAHAVAVSGGPVTFTLDPSTDFAIGESCTVTVTASQVSDQDSNDPPDTMAADYVLHFATANAAVHIHDVQGAAHISPMVGSVVTLAASIVTGVRTNGYYVQDPSPDANDATSEGIFVFTSTAPTVSLGDEVSVTGTVTEFRGGGATSPGLTVTEISGPSASVLSTGNPLPAPTVLGIGGRAVPTDVIENDATNVETSGVFDPAQDGIDFWESLEGMRVQVNNAVASGPTTSFGEISVLADNGVNAGVRTTRGGIVIRPTDFNPERIILDDPMVATPMVNVGDHFSGPIVGIMDYSFNNPKLNVTTAVTGIGDGVTRETTAAPGPGELATATINLENLDPGDPPDKINRLAAIIVDNMQSPDLMSVEEVQDNTGPTDDGTVDASNSYAALINAISAAGGPTYQFRQINPVNDQDGGEPGGNIRVGFLFRTDRGLAFVDRPGGDSTTAVTVQPGPHLSISPGRIDPTNPAFNSSRKPLAGEFTYNGATLFVVANHFNSKGGDDPLYGKNQPPTRSSETQRHQQAQIVNDFVDSILAQNANADVLVMGDINDFEFSTTMDILEGGVMTALMKTLPQAERYSYVFEGNSQSLDHMVVSSHLLAAKTGFDAVHVNAEFADQASDHDPMVGRFAVTSNAAPTVDAGGPYSIPEGGGGTLTATGSDANGDPLTYAWDLDNNGTFETPGQSVAYSAAGLDGPVTKTAQVQVTDSHGATGVDTATINITNVAPTITSVTTGDHAICGAGSPITVSFTDPGGGETYDATVNWGGGVVEHFSNVSSPFTPMHTYPTAGRKVASVTISDDDGGVSGPDATALYVDYTVVGGGVQQPLNATGPMSVFKAGSVIGVRLQLRDCDGTFPSTLAPTLGVALVNSDTPGKVNEDKDKSAPDIGSTLRFDSATNSYIYNFGTGALPDQKATYRFTITVPSTGQTTTVDFGIR